MCRSCGAGFYSSAWGLKYKSECIPCPAGTYSSHLLATNDSTCLDCKAGTYSSNTAQDSSDKCIHCPAGTYSVVMGSNSSESCIPCPQGTYSNVTGAFLPETCRNCRYVVTVDERKNSYTAPPIMICSLCMQPEQFRNVFVSCWCILRTDMLCLRHWFILSSTRSSFKFFMQGMSNGNICR